VADAIGERDFAYPRSGRGRRSSFGPERRSHEWPSLLVSFAVAVVYGTPIPVGMEEEQMTACLVVISWTAAVGACDFAEKQNFLWLEAVEHEIPAKRYVVVH
jgi:hypothetical protein